MTDAKGKTYNIPTIILGGVIVVALVDIENDGLHNEMAPRNSTARLHCQVQNLSFRCCQAGAAAPSGGVATLTHHEGEGQCDAHGQAVGVSQGVGGGELHIDIFLAPFNS